MTKPLEIQLVVYENDEQLVKVIHEGLRDKQPGTTSCVAIGTVEMYERLRDILNDKYPEYDTRYDEVKLPNSDETVLAMSVRRTARWN